MHMDSVHGVRVKDVSIEIKAAFADVLAELPGVEYEEFRLSAFRIKVHGKDWGTIRRTAEMRKWVHYPGDRGNQTISKYYRTFELLVEAIRAATETE